MAKRHEYFVYILRCSDKTYYTGITNNWHRRLNEHQTGRSRTCYTFQRRPVTLVHVRHFQWVLDAIAWEKQVKRWSRRKKEALIQDDFTALHTLATCLNGTNYRLHHRLACQSERSRGLMRGALGVTVRLRSP